VSDVAAELGCDWHTGNDAVVAYGEALLAADTDRVGQVGALGLDETLFVRTGRFRTQSWCTSITDVSPGRQARLIEVIQGRTAAEVSGWIDTAVRRVARRDRLGVLDMSGPYRKVYDDSLPDAVQVADPSTSSSTPTASSTSAGAACRTRPSVTAATKTTRSTDPAGC